MERILTQLILVLTAVAVSNSCSRPIKKYYFQQVGLYMTITFEDGYGYAIFSRDGNVTTISEDIDYIRMRPFESTCVSLVLNPKCKGIVYVNDSWEESYINSKELTLIRIKTDSTFYYRQKIPGGPDANWVRPEFYVISILDNMDLVVYKETGENKKYTIAKPYHGPPSRKRLLQ
jgi:hypothetical protein